MTTESEAVGPTVEDNRALSLEAANKLLARIARLAQSDPRPEQVKDLADAYTTVVGAMPKREGSRGRVTTM